ncbi:polysaccharide pyruvyl transferase family protein [Mediterranea massiliensis]|uniref:polysaccharide pyruvyl transferase family protein n=1 Tax=Mediterranea massiliensis TaxID=1841865 RepID=UPI00320B4DA5
MKISILTFSKEDNFGANLQCYALTKTLQNMGHNVDIIDIQLSPMQSSLINKILQYYQHYNFQQFRKRNINKYFTRRYKNVDELIDNPPESDLYVVGSDQVWNPNITKRLDPLIYFFSFLPPNATRISYAASFGFSTWENKELIPKVSKLLNQFSKISVREKEGVNICKDFFHAEATEVCDPTFLLPNYDEICGEYRKEKETNNILYFKFIRNENAENVIANYAKTQNQKYIKLLNFHMTPNSIIKPYVKVDKWLENIRYSKLIISDSFHCIVFCILFHKNFIAMPSIENRAGRILNLLQKLNLSDHFCSDAMDLSQKINQLANKKINYQATEFLIKEMRDKSIKFLLNALHNKYH